VSAPGGMSGPLRAAARRVAGTILPRRCPAVRWPRADMGTAAAASRVDDDRVGAFGLAGLHEPSDFDRLARRAVAKSDELMAGLVSLGPSASTGGAATSVIDDLDEISDTLCAVVDVAELCRNVHPDQRWVSAATNAYVQLQGYVQGLNSNRGLYLALVNAQERHASELSPEALRVALTLRQDFERGGIHLGRDEHAALEKAAGDVVRLGMAFQQNLADPKALGFVDVSRLRLGGVPVGLTRSPRTSGGTTQRDDGEGLTARVPLDQRTVSAVLRYADDPETRKAVYLAAHAGPEANRSVLAGLLRARHESAKILGFESHAHFATAPLLAEHPDAPRALLERLARESSDRAGEEIEMMSRLGGGRGSGNRGGKVRGWDRSYLIGKARAKACDLDVAQVASYFPLERVLRGVGSLVHRVFGVKLTEVPMDSGESWHAKVRKLRVTAGDAGLGEGEEIGTIYLDLEPRPRKFTHAAHFVIRCSRGTPGPHKQRPAVALVCNFGAGSATTLSHSEVETFLHEFGHAMHSVLSDTRYQHLSGTRCAMDMVEVPSHLFEYFAWDPRALNVLTSHRVTGDPMPDAMIERLRASKELFGATDLQQQCVFALTDLEVHALDPATLTDGSVSEVAARVQRTHSLMPVEDGTSWELRFGHLVGYASTYYSYPYAKCVAADLWEKFFAGDPLAPGAGEALREGMLRHGGAREPRRILRDMLGDGSIVTDPVGAAPDPTSMLADLNRGR